MKLSLILILSLIMEGEVMAVTNDTVKGSKKCIRLLVNNNQTTLNNTILSSSASLLSFSDGKITWVSPLTSNNFKEFQDDFLQKLGLMQSSNPISSYWPPKGPVWDGLAYTQDRNGNKGILLIEAKSHISETSSSIKAKDKKSMEKINYSMNEAKEHMNILPNVNWLQNSYQLSNRLTFMFLLNEKIGIPTWLVLINFVNDSSYIPTKKEEWLKHYKNEFSSLGFNERTKLLDKIVLVFQEAPKQ